MSFAYLALYTGDYLRDTRHLTPLKHGVYLLLLMHCWDSRGPVPLDEQECAGIANCRSADEIDALRYILAKYFTKMDDGHYNRRIQLEIERANAISNARSGAGKKGYEAKAKQLLSKSQASASTPTTTTISTPTTTITAKVKSTALVPRASRLTIIELPEDWRVWCAAERPDLNAMAVFDEFRDHWIAVAGKAGCKLDWQATWRNWCRRQRGQNTARTREPSATMRGLMELQTIKEGLKK